MLTDSTINLEKMWHAQQFILVLLLCVSGRFAPCVPAAPSLDMDCRHLIPYTTVDGNTLTLDIYRPLGSAADLPVILMLHGGRWVRSDVKDLRPVIDLVTRHGYAVVTIEYRLAPTYLFPAQLEDVRSAVRWMAEHAAEFHFDMHHFIAMGVSAGGQLAALLALQPAAQVPPAAGVILCSAPTDFTLPPPSLTAKVAIKLYLGAERSKQPEVYRQASPITFVTAASPPFLIIHGKKDALIPYDQADRMAKALRAVKVPVTLVPIPNLHHDMPKVNGVEWRLIMDNLLRFLTDITRTQPVVTGVKPNGG